MAALLSVVPNRADKIDRFGELARRIQEFAPILEEHSTLKKEMEDWYAEADNARRFAPEGELYTVQVSARGQERTITDPMKAWAALRKTMSLDAVVALVTIPLGGAIDKFIPESKHAMFLVKEQTGPRKFVAVAKASPAAPKKAA